MAAFLNPLSGRTGNLYGMGIIRILLAISVVIAHSSLFLGYNIANGLVAVQIFYMFSGFYMFMILSEHYTSVRKFYKSRALRALPHLFPGGRFCPLCLVFLRPRVRRIYRKTGPVGCCRFIRQGLHRCGKHFYVFSGYRYVFGDRPAHGQPVFYQQFLSRADALV